MGNFLNRVLRAVRLDAQLFEEVENDTEALQQALFVVVLVSIASGIGFGGGRVFGGIGASLLGWFLWSFVTYFIGTKLLAEKTTKSNYGELLRTVGFACAPGLLLILGVFSFLRGLLFPVVQIWTFLAMVVAVRQALDYQSTGRAVMVCFFGWLSYFLVFLVFNSLSFG